MHPTTRKRAGCAGAKSSCGGAVVAEHRASSSNRGTRESPDRKVMKMLEEQPVENSRERSQKSDKGVPVLFVMRGYVFVSIAQNLPSA